MEEQKILSMPGKKAGKGEKKESPKMISVEQANAQVQQIATQANTKIRQLATQLHQLEEVLRDKTIDHLFKVVEYSHLFNEDFVAKCIGAIEEYLTQMALSKSESQEEAKEPEATTEEPESKKENAE